MATCFEPGCFKIFTLPFEPGPGQTVYCRDHMIYDAAEAQALGAADYDDYGCHQNKGKVHKSVKSSYDDGYHNRRRYHKEADYNARQRSHEAHQQREQHYAKGYRAARQTRNSSGPG